MNIIKTITDFDICSSGTTYIEDVQLRISVYRDSIRFTDIADALKTGKVCKVVSLNASYTAVDKCAIINWFNSIEDIRGFVLNAVEDDLGDIKVYVNEDKSVRTFSPFNINVIKPLKSSPAKWSVRNAMKALLNGQYTDLQVDSNYTDDYAYDAAVNFGKGAIEDVLEFCQGIIEGPSGWRVWESDGKITVNCHHFNYNSFKLVIT